jgi:septum formation inhibitor MinC
LINPILFFNTEVAPLFSNLLPEFELEDARQKKRRETYANLTAEVREHTNGKAEARLPLYQCKRAEKLAREENEKLACEMAPDQHRKRVSNLTAVSKQTQEVTPQSVLINSTLKSSSTIFHTCFF